MEYFRVEVKILCGAGLSKMDAFGKSDPYLKVMEDDELLYKTDVKNNTLNPEWNEQCVLQVAKRDTKLKFKVFDFDISSVNDFMGEAIVDLAQIKLNDSIEMTLQLSNDNDKGDSGKIDIRITIIEDTLEDQLDGVSAKLESLIGIVWIVLVEAKHILPIKGVNDHMLCTFSLGRQEKRSMKVPTSQNPIWMEPHSLDWFEGHDNYLELSLMNDKDIFTRNERIGRCSISLKNLFPDVTQNMWLPLKDTESGMVNVLVTVTATEDTVKKQSIVSNQDGDVGHLSVKVLQADGLEPKLFTKRQPFVVLELVNQRVQTRPGEGNIGLEWNKIFSFSVSDIYTELEVTILDDVDKMFLGKVVIPLTQIQSAKKKWYRLKNKSLRKRAKGEDPRILLEISLSFDYLKAALKLFLPKERKYECKFEDKLKISTLNGHLTRIREVQARMTPPEKVLKEIENIVVWKHPTKTCGILYGILLGVWILELWMIPVLIMGPFLFCLMKPGLNNISAIDVTNNEEDNIEEEESTFLDGAVLHNKALIMQEYLGSAAHLLESLENVVNFCDPIVSCLVLVLLLISAIILYLVPFRIILILLILRLFSKSLYNPFPTNKLFNFISRLQDNQQMMDYRELPAEN